jgi:O-antigen ligase
MKENLYKKIIKWLVMASFFTPLIVLDYFYFPFIVPKTIIFQILIELALFFYLLLVFSNKSYLPKLDMLTRAVLLFFGVYVIAAVFGENVFRSFFGVFERMLGIFNLAHFVVLFLMLRSVFTEKKDWILLFRAFLIAGSIVGLYGLGQKMGLTFLYNSGASRIDATIGNAAFFAAYMMFNAFFAVFLLFTDKSKFYIFYWISLFISLLGVYLSSTRGAILGLSVGILFFLFSLFKHRYFNFESLKFLNRKKLAIWMLGIVLVSVLTVSVFGPKAFLDPIKRISSISVNDDTTKTRILSAGVSFNGFLEHPVLGWGSENYNLVFDKYYDPRLYPTEQWFDHAHNIIFDNLISAGILGLLAYLLVFVAAFFLLSKYAKVGKKSFFISYLFMSLLLAYFFQNLFVFDALATYLPFFITLAFIGFMTLSEDDKKKSVNKYNSVPIGVFITFFILIGSFVYFFNVKPLVSSYYGLRALATSPANPEKVLEYFDKSLNWGLQGKPEIRTRMIDHARKVAKVKNMPEELKRKFFDKVEQEGMKAIEEEPKNFRYYSYLANMAVIDRENKDFVKKMDLMLDDTISMAPRKQMLYLQRYQLKAMLGQNEEALENLKMFLDLYYDFKLTMVLALNYKEIGQRDKAINIYKALLKRQDLISRDRLSIAIEFASMGENRRAIRIAQNLIQKDPTFSKSSLKFIEDVESGKFRDRK